MLLAFCKLDKDSANITKELAEKLLIEFEYDLDLYLNRDSCSYIALKIHNLNLQFVIYSTWEIELFRYQSIPIIELNNYESYVKRMHELFLTYKLNLDVLKTTREILIEELKHL